MGCLAEEHLVEYDAHGPHIAFGGVGAAVQDLRAHVHRRAY
jgi:hypothetical protein